MISAPRATRGFSAPVIVLFAVLANWNPVMAQIIPDGCGECDDDWILGGWHHEFGDDGAILTCESSQPGHASTCDGPGNYHVGLCAEFHVVCTLTEEAQELAVLIQQEEWSSAVAIVAKLLSRETDSAILRGSRLLTPRCDGTTAVVALPPHILVLLPDRPNTASKGGNE